MEAAIKGGTAGFADDGVARMFTHHFCRFDRVRVVAATPLPLLGACFDSTAHYYMSWPSEMGDLPSSPCSGSE